MVLQSFFKNVCRVIVLKEVNFMAKPITESDLYKALGAKLKPVMDALEDIKNQLGNLNATVSNLDGRVRAIESRLVEKKTNP